MKALNKTQQVAVGEALRRGLTYTILPNGAVKINYTTKARKPAKGLASTLGVHVGRRDRKSKVTARVCWNKVSLERK